MKFACLIIGGSGALGEALVPKIENENLVPIIADVKKPLFEGNVGFIFLDATNPDSYEEVLKTLKEEQVDVAHVVNCVGILVEQGLTDIFKTSAQEIDRTIDLNFKSQLYAVRFLGEYIMSGASPNKSFTLISSINANRGYSIPFYSAAKSGLMGFIRPVATELGEFGVRINAVSPGSVKTPVTEQQPKNFEKRAESAALKRLAECEEVADGVICCMKLTAMTGQELVIDAGQSVNPSESLYDQRRRESGNIKPPHA